jgi:hypothetical protein
MRFEHWLYTIPLRLRSLFRRHDVESELEEEIRFHVERQIAEATARGEDTQAARRGVAWRSAALSKLRSYAVTREGHAG